MIQCACNGELGVLHAYIHRSVRFTFSLLFFRREKKSINTFGRGVKFVFGLVNAWLASCNSRSQVLERISCVRVCREQPSTLANIFCLTCDIDFR